jgi:hypothetical protein
MKISPGTDSQPTCSPKKRPNKIPQITPKRTFVDRDNLDINI